MRNKHIRRLMLLIPFSGALLAQAQTATETKVNTAGAVTDTVAVETRIEEGLRSEKEWRSTFASYSVTGDELARMTTGNLLNTLQGRIPGLTVMTGSGEPGYDNPTLYGRGLSSWNIGGNSLAIVLDGFQVGLEALSSLSAHEIESVTYLKDAAALAIYGLDGGSGALVVKTKRGFESGKTQITVNGRYGVQSFIDLPSVMNAYDYTRLYNQARANDGLTMRYADPELYKNGGDAAHPDVDWYDEVLKPYSQIQDYNVAFRGGSKNARYYVLLDYANFTGMYKNADEIDKDFGTNAVNNKFNLRGNVDVNITNDFSVNAQVSGIIEDTNTPGGFTASSLFDNLMGIPASAFSVKNPNGSWGNSTVYNFNPVMLLKTGGVYNAHARNVQTNFGFQEKLDAVTPGLSLNGAISFTNRYVGNTAKTFSVLSYQLLKDLSDNPLLDANGGYTYSEIGSITDNISDGLTSHYNRNSIQLGLNYERAFGKHSVTGMVLAKRSNYTYNGLIFPIRSQGVSFAATYDFDKRYVVDLSAGYTGSADYEEGHRYGLFPAVGLAWIASNESFLKDIEAIDFLKVRASYGLTGNTNTNYRFLYEQLSETNSGWLFKSSNTWYTGRREGAIPNTDFTWEEKKTMNVGVDAKLFDMLSVNVDYFHETRTGILENASAYVPDYTGFRLSNTNTGEVRNSGFEAVLGVNDKVGAFEYYAKGMVSFARNEITKRAETFQPHEWLYQEGYRINQFRGLVYDGFYQASDFESDGLLKDGVVKSTYANARAGDMKYKDQNNDGLINDYDVVPIDYSSLPELTYGFNLGFKFKGFDFDAFFQGVANRTVLLPTNYIMPFVGNNNITEFSRNAWTPETALTATAPRLTTQNNANNYRSSDFYMRDGSFIKLRSVELGYSFALGKIQNIRTFVNGTNLFTWDSIDDLEAERLSSGYPLGKSVSVGVKVNF